MSAEQARVDAYAALMADVQRAVIATREDARARIQLAYYHFINGGTAPDQDARFWAADHLLAQLLGLPAPTVPEDPEPGQGDPVALADELSPQPVDRPVDGGRWPGTRSPGARPGSTATGASPTGPWPGPSGTTAPRT